MANRRREAREMRERFESRLAAHLIRRGLVGLEEMEEATRQQVVMGGHLSTNLWELGLADGGMLSRLSAKILRVPEIDTEQLARIPRKVLDMLPLEFVERVRILPFEVDRSSLRVATAEPWDHLALGEAAFHSGFPVQVYFVAEVPLVRLLAKYYPIPLQARFVSGRLQAEREGGEAAAKIIRAEKGAGISETPWSDLPELPADIATVIAVGEAPVVHAPNERELPEEEPALPPIATLGEALAELDSAEDRDAMGRVLVRFALSRGKRVALLIHGRRQWSGWLAAGEGVDSERLRSLVLPDEKGTVFALVSHTGAHFMGMLTAHAVHQRFLGALGRAVPGAVCLLPVHFRGKLAFGVYLDAGQGTDVSTDVAEILVLAQRIPAALERLVKQQLARRDGERPSEG